MGIEIVYPVGTVLTRNEKQGDSADVVRVVGGGDKIVVTPHEEYGNNFELDVRVAREQYAADLPEGTELQRVPPVGNQGLSPEQVFAKEARGQTARRVRKGTKVDSESVIEDGKDK